jgi:hypothetical protein
VLRVLKTKETHKSQYLKLTRQFVEVEELL